MKYNLFITLWMFLCQYTVLFSQNTSYVKLNGYYSLELKYHKYGDAITWLNENKSKLLLYDFYYKKAFVNYKLGDYKKAVVLMDSALLQSPEIDSFYRHRGNFKISSGDTLNGRKDLFHAIKLNPLSIFNNLYLAKYYLISNKIDSMYFFLQKSKEINGKSKHEEFQILNVEFTYLIENNKFDRAKKILKEINQLLPNSGISNYQNYRYYAMQNKQKQALNFISKVILNDSGIVDIYDRCHRSELIVNLIGGNYDPQYYTKGELKQLSIAEDDLLSVIQFDSMHSHAYLRLAYIYMYTDEINKSLYYLGKSENFNDLYKPEIGFLKSLALTKLGLPDSSNKTINMFLNDLPKDNFNLMMLLKSFNFFLISNLDSATYYLSLTNQKNYKNLIDLMGFEISLLYDIIDELKIENDDLGSNYYNAAVAANLIGDKKLFKELINKAKERGNRKAIEYKN